jgi:formyltetrahydrofolate synthetase
MNAHNLAMVALTARMQHERNYNDEQLKRLTKMKRLDIDPTRVEMGWIIDYCAQSLRNIVIGLGGRQDGYHHAVQIRHCGLLRVDGDSLDRQGPCRT